MKKFYCDFNLAAGTTKKTTCALEGVKFVPASEAPGRDWFSTSDPRTDQETART